MSAASAGLDVIAQLTPTAPVKPPLGVIEMVDVPVPPAEATLMVVPLSENVAGAVAASIVTSMAVVSDRLPETAVTVAVYEPGGVATCEAMMSVDVAGADPEIKAG
jgi:hypothetical protein